jgi:hypothetical protein
MRSSSPWNQWKYQGVEEDGGSDDEEGSSVTMTPVGACTSMITHSLATISSVAGSVIGWGKARE